MKKQFHKIWEKPTAFKNIYPSLMGLKKSLKEIKEAYKNSPLWMLICSENVLKISKKLTRIRPFRCWYVLKMLKKIK